MRIIFKDLSENKELAKQVFEKMDDEFKYYLGFEDSIDNFVTEVTESDKIHKYWALFFNNALVGLIYIYAYSEKYKKCSIGYGLFPEYRGKNFTPAVLTKFCSYLEDELGIVRIQVDIEVANEHCLSCFEKCGHAIGFKYECTADNYWGKDCACKIYSRCK